MAMWAVAGLGIGALLLVGRHRRRRRRTLQAGYVSEAWLREQRASEPDPW